MEKQNKIVALYCRLSRDDESEGYSSSIMSQKQILGEYARQHGMTQTEFFIDDGYSGTNFQRPGWQDLIARVEKGEVSTIICKDSSRMARNYLQAGLYREMFHDKGIRLICVTDGIDTANGEDDFTPFREIMSEWYARDCSRKVKAGYRAKALSGEFTGPYAPYGYLKSPDDKHKLIPNPETADVVKRIFQMAASGMTAYKISAALRRDCILKPRAYTMQSTNGKYQSENLMKHPYDWTRCGILSIIQNEVYLGHLVCNRHTSKSFKSKKLVVTDRSEWIITKNTHEPLIDEQTFEQAQKATEVKRKTSTGEPHMFAGLLRCPDCGKAMHYLIRPGRTYTASYSCNTYSRYGKGYCSMHYIRYEDLYAVVLNDIRQYAELAKSHEQEFIEALSKSGSDNTKKQMAQYEKEITKTEKRLSEVSLIIKRLYEDSVTGKLTDERFCELSKGYEAESAELKAKAREARKAIVAYGEATDNSRQFTALIKKYFEIEALDAPMLNELVNKIEVHEREISNGEREQKIDIFYNFVGILSDSQHTLHDRRWREGRSPAYAAAYESRTAARLENVP